MLTFKPIKCPPEGTDLQPILTPLAEMVGDYCVELGVGDGLSSFQDFVVQWVLHKHHIMGIYSGDELVGMIVATLRHKLFSAATVLVVEMIYLKRGHRSEGLSIIPSALAAGKVFAKEVDADTLIIHADVQYTKSLAPGDGEHVYTAVEYIV